MPFFQERGSLRSVSRLAVDQPVTRRREKRISFYSRPAGRELCEAYKQREDKSSRAVLRLCQPRRRRPGLLHHRLMLPAIVELDGGAAGLDILSDVVPGVDDAASTVYFPMYSCSTRVPFAFAVGNGSMMQFTDKAAFWVFNQVTNFAYTRYNVIHPDIRAKQKALETQYKNFVEITDAGASALYPKDPALTVEFLTDFSCNTGNQLVDTWRDFYGYLFCRYMDGNIKTPVPGEKNPKVENPPLPEWYLRTIIEKTGKKLEVLGQ